MLSCLMPAMVAGVTTEAEGSDSGEATQSWWWGLGADQYMQWTHRQLMESITTHARPLHTPGAVSGVKYMNSLNPFPRLSGKYYYLHFIGVQTEAQRGEIPWPGSHRL